MRDDIINRLRNVPKYLAYAIGVIAVGLIGLADYFTGVEISLSIFYLVVICLAVWLLNRTYALCIAVLSIYSWLMGDFAAGAKFSQGFIPYWNAIMMMTVYIAMILVLFRLRSLHDSLESKIKERTASLTAEIQMREFLEKALLDISEREQRRMGQDLHDSLCQHLTGTALAGKVLSDTLTSNQRVEAKAAENVVTLVEEAITMARQLARGLVPVALEQEGLVLALENFVATTSRRFGVSCRLEIPHPVEVEELAIALHVYRIVQEAMVNAIRHGAATEVCVGLTATFSGLVLSITDNGCGFSTGEEASTGERRGMGLQIMKHRCSIIGGVFSVQSSQQGTVVKCVLEGI